ncbi:intermembrane transport protein PqiB [Chromobacterium vaccinii]|uniref:PqiB family protein n=1 Tax=Chromobacterium vaccinii TaxID=1108595 RepID=UPI003C741F7F
MADNLGSLSVGSPVYFRRVPVGQLASYTLEKSGRFVRLDVFIAAPYDRFVSDDSRFWHASGVDVSLNAEGLNVNTQSLAAIALGGIAFETPAADAYAPPRKDAVFLLNENRTKALQAPDLEVKLFRLRFTQSVRGLTVGAPVDFRGIVIGEVAAIGVDYAPARQDFDMTVDVRLYPRRLLSLSGRSGRLRRMSAESLVRNGLRAQLRSGSLITGQLYVALDFFKEAPPAQLVQRDGVPELPTMPGDLEELQRVLQRVARRLDKVPFDTIAGHLDQSLLATRQTLDSVRQLSGKLDKEGMPALLKTLEALQRTLEQTQQILSPDAPAQQDVRAAAQEITEAARSFRALTETLERQPQALIRGKREEK